MDKLSIFSFLIGVIGSLLSAIGVALTLISLKRIKKSMTMDWNSIRIASRTISKKLEKDGVYPHLVLAQSPGAALIGKMITDGLGISIPIYSGFKYERSTKLPDELIQNYIVINGPKYNFYLPALSLSKEYAHILIVDDRVGTGDFLQECKKLLTNTYNLNCDSIVTCGIMVEKSVITNNKSPDYYVFDSASYYLPWD